MANVAGRFLECELNVNWGRRPAESDEGLHRIPASGRATTRPEADWILQDCRKFSLVMQLGLCARPVKREIRLGAESRTAPLPSFQTLLRLKHFVDYDLSLFVGRDHFMDRRIPGHRDVDDVVARINQHVNW
jgi:hypothetical protein